MSSTRTSVSDATAADSCNIAEFIASELDSSGVLRPIGSSSLRTSLDGERGTAERERRGRNVRRRRTIVSSRPRARAGHRARPAPLRQDAGVRRAGSGRRTSRRRPCRCGWPPARRWPLKRDEHAGVRPPGDRSMNGPPLVVAQLARRSTCRRAGAASQAAGCVFSQLAWMSGSGAGPWQVSMPSGRRRGVSWLPSFEDPMSVSSPALPEILSMPRPPSMLSTPVPPVIVSLPTPPVIVSARSVPVIVSLPPLPVIVLAGVTPPQSIVSLLPPPTTVVSVCVTPGPTTQSVA